MFHIRINFESSKKLENKMSDGSPSLFDRVLDTSPDNTENKFVMPWHRSKKIHVVEETLAEFSNGKIS